MITEAGEILLRRGLLSPEQLKQSRAQANGVSIIESAIERGFVKEEDALKALAEEVGLDYVDLRETEVDLSLLRIFPQKLIYRHSLFPIRRDNGSLVVATSNPLDLYPLDEAAAVTGLSITPIVAEKIEIAKLVKKHLGVGSETVEGLMAARGKRRRLNSLRRSRPTEAN